MSYDLTLSDATEAPSVPLSVDLRQAASLLGVSEDVVRERVEDGRLAGMLVGGQWRVLLAEPVDIGTDEVTSAPFPASGAAMAYLEMIRDTLLAPLVAELSQLHEQIARLREQREVESRRAEAAIGVSERERTARASDQEQADRLVTLLEAQIESSTMVAARLTEEQRALAAENARLQRALTAISSLNAPDVPSRGNRLPGAFVPVAKRLAAAAAALALLTAAAFVPTAWRIGPVMFPVTPDRGLHALDVAVLAVALPVAVTLLRYAGRGHSLPHGLANSS